MHHVHFAGHAVERVSGSGVVPDAATDKLALEPDLNGLLLAHPHQIGQHGAGRTTRRSPYRARRAPTWGALAIFLRGKLSASQALLRYSPFRERDASV